MVFREAGKKSGKVPRRRKHLRWNMNMWDFNRPSCDKRRSRDISREKQ
jgi:hypothetical protein